MARAPQARKKMYVLDTNVLIHDPNALLNFEEHDVIIPMTVLEELDSLKSGKQTVAADCRQAIRNIDKLLGDASPKDIEKGVPIVRGEKAEPLGTLSILMTTGKIDNHSLPEHLNDNKIINSLAELQARYKSRDIILVSKDINMRLKARGFGVEAQDYHNDQLLDDIDLLPKGYHEFPGSFWDRIEKVETVQREAVTEHILKRENELTKLYINEFVLDEMGFLGRVVDLDNDTIVLQDLHRQDLMDEEVWGLV